MAIKIGGKLENVQDPKKTIADASQIVTSTGEDVEEKLLSLKSSIESTSSTVEAISKKYELRKFESMDAAELALKNKEISLGDAFTVNSGASSDEKYSVDYKLYVVAIDAETNKETLKEISGGGGSEEVNGKVTLEVTKVEIDGVDTAGAELLEANIGSKIDIYYDFLSLAYPDAPGTVVFRRGSTDIFRESVYPDGSSYKLPTYTVENIPAGTYQFTIYGQDKTRLQSARTKYTIIIGGLSINSSFSDSDAVKSGDSLRIPFNVTAADENATVEAIVNINDSEFTKFSVNAGSNNLDLATGPGTALDVGNNIVEIYLKNSKGKVSNVLKYNITVAEEGIIYLTLPDETIKTSEGSRLEIPVKILQLNSKDEKYSVRLDIKNSSGESKYTQTYTFNHGTSIMSIMGLSNSIDPYIATVTVSGTDENTAASVSDTVQIIVEKNNYNIPLKGNENLLCSFSASGKSNNTTDRDTWKDDSGKNIKATFNNFNWIKNGWIDDENGDTALTLNSGAYVELDIAPFLNDIPDNEAITFSIDFSTEDVLDSQAKVISCLKEQPGEETTEYYLRDTLGEYVKHDDTVDSPETPNNIVNFFRNSGGYCWLNGITYGSDENPIDENIEYDTAVSVGERTINYNIGDENPAYNTTPGEKPVDYRKFTGTKKETVTKQTGIYIDTQYAVLTNPASPANVLDKFYLNFSESTRTRIDFIITRIKGDAVSKDDKGKETRLNPYCFKAMVGYTNGILSLMKVLPDNDKFAHGGKIYLGCKGLIDANNKVNISQTGSARIYSFRMYNRALTPAEIVNNYAASLTNPEEKKLVIDNNGILSVDSVAKLPYMEIIGYRYPDVADDRPNVEKYSIYKFIMQLLSGTGTSISDLKKLKEPGYVRYYDPVQEKFWGISSEWSDTAVDIPARLQFQGTSSMVYPVKNYKIRLHKTDHVMGTDGIEYGKKLKKDIGNGNSESTFCLKADYMDSSHCNNTGSANFISDYNKISGLTPATVLDDSFRTTIYGYPILLYYRENTGSTDRHFIGVYNLNLDKSCTGSFGFEEELKDSEKNLYKFSNIRFIDDAASEDILRRIELPFDETWVESGEIEVLVREGSEQLVRSRPLYKLEGTPIAVNINDKYYKLTVFDDETYVALENPASGIECALLTKEGFILAVDGTKFSSTQCFEFKANSGATGAGGFGNYAIDSISKDLENRYPDDGDLEDENYKDYVKAVTSEKAIDFAHYRAPLYYNIRRNIRWLKDASKDDFRANVYKYYDITYMLDYYLTIMLLGGVDSLGKNLMVASWGPENHLYEATEDYDDKTFEYIDPYDNSVKYLTPTKVALFTETYYDEDAKQDKERTIYKYAYNSKGQHLYFKEDVYNRYQQKFIVTGASWNQDIVTTVPGEGIQRPIFYDIDTINGLDNSGQLIFDCDIEIGDVLDDGTAVFNTDDSNLWGRVRDYMFDETKARWETLRNRGYFTLDNLVGEFYHKRQISKIPETYYNDDCFLKYIWEGPVGPGELLPNGSIANGGGGTYLYCIHGSRYEHMKRWYGQRMEYIDSMFGIMGADNSSLRFNHAFYDANYKSESNYYESYPQLVSKYPGNYSYKADTGKLYTADGKREIVPIQFNVKTYQPGYVGVKWSNTSSILYYRLGRDDLITISGNVPSAGDSEVFLFGGKNIKDIGDMNPYNVKQIDFKNMTKLSKLILGGDTKCVIDKLDLGVNTYLTELNLRRCSNLLTVDIGACTNIRNVYMSKSGVTSITLPNGGALENIEFSDAITSINLNGFINLSTVTIGSLGNLTELSIKDCPKILGTEDLRSSKAWNILQQTKDMSVDNDTKVELTAYGDAEPTIYSDGEFFFADKFWNVKTSENIRGDVIYKGNTIPANYAKFTRAYPKLRIHYPNITDASGMFENYKNINTISTIRVKYGADASGDKYRTVYYWTDETPELQTKWHNSAMYNKYGYSTTHSYDIGYYQEGSTYYRLLNVYDDEDLNEIRRQIKENISIFNGGRFTNINRMFKGMDILDYIDPDTFNEIDLSSATSDELFSGCTALKYFVIPGDKIKNRPVYVYYDSEGNEVNELDWDSTTGTKEQKTNNEGQLIYENDLTGESIYEEVDYKKGLRDIGNEAFYECRDARVLIKKLSNSDKLTINPSAFTYLLFDPTKEVQERTVTCQRPAIMFEYSENELLKIIDKETDYPVGDGRYYSLNNYGEREINFENKYIDFKNSNKFLREVYFNVNDIIINKNITDTETISYGEMKNGMKIILDVNTTNSELASFNISNSQNVYSVAQAGFYNISEKCSEIESPLPKYDCLDSIIPRQDYENVIMSLFTKKNITALDKTSMEAVNPKFTKFHIINTKEIPDMCFRYSKNIEFVSADDELKYIGSEAFRESSLIRLCYKNLTTESCTRDLKVVEIGSSAFEGCLSMTSFYMPETLSKLHNAAFKDCSNLSIVYANDVLVEIPSSCFINCSALYRFANLSLNVEKIEADAFRNCKLLPIIGSANDAVFGRTLGNYTKIKYIGNYAFEKCNELTAAVPPADNPTRIDKLEIPTSLEYIGSNAFAQDLGRDSVMFIEFVWDPNGNYSKLEIGSNAFTNVRTAWKPVGYTDPITDIIYIPRIGSIGSNAFKSRSGATAFKLAFTDMSKNVGSSWVSEVAKIIYNYSGMNTINNATYIFSDDGTEKFAYLHYINEILTKLDIPVYVEYDNERYYVKEILKGALNLSGNDLSNIIFQDPDSCGSKLDTVETGVLISSSLIGIITRYNENGTMKEYPNIIPSNITIASGNTLKDTTWFDQTANSGFVTLGKYIIGYKPLDGEIVSQLDFTELTNCKTIYDNAFAGMDTLESVNLSGIEAIYTNAFVNCTGMRSIDIPRSLTYIGGSAFIGCPLTTLFIPNTVKSIGTAPFGIATGVGKLESVIIEDGSEITTLPFVISKEINTNDTLGGPATVNITLKHLHIPASMGRYVSASDMKLLSQVHKLTIGNLKVNTDDGSYLFDNYPLYRDTNGNMSITETEGSTRVKDDSGKQLYCPRFYYDMMKDAGYESSLILTTEAKSYYPYGDKYDGDTVIEEGFAAPLDIGYIMTYKDPKPINTEDAGKLDIQGCKDLTSEDIMRIVAGFTKTSLNVFPLSIRKTDYDKLSTMEKLAAANYRIKFVPYANK